MQMGSEMAKPRLNFLQIWNMCFGFLGIQVGFGLQNANASRIFQTLGAEVDHLAILWIAAPVTGLLVQPIIGHLSDKTWGRLGRRRPYFFYGALVTTAALVFMPLSPVLWLAAGALWIMDASINVTMEPFRAFVGDLLPEEQRTTGFAMQSFFIGIGAVLASVLPWVLTNWFAVSNVAAPGEVPDSVRIAFHVGAAALFLSVMWTVFTTREYSPAELEEMDRATGPDASPGPATPVQQRHEPRYFVHGLVWATAGVAATWLVALAKLQKELFVLTGFIILFGLVQVFAGWMRRRRGASSGLVEIVDDLFNMPDAMRQLAVVQFFSWFGLFAMWIYTTPAVTAFHYGSTDTASEAFNSGADWVGVLFGIYNGVAALAAFLIPVVSRRIGQRGCHALNLCLGGLGLLSFLIIHDPRLLWISMIGVGIAWASILSVPYAILSRALPPRKMGVYMGIFNFFIVIPQLVAATILGLLLQAFFGGQPIFALVLGGASMVVAALCVFGVSDPARARAPG